jgi:hypothetical protein
MERQFRYEIRVEGQISENWTDWFHGLAIRNLSNGEGLLSGPLPDQAALLGVLTRLQGLNLTVISVERSPWMPG